MRSTFADRIRSNLRSAASGPEDIQSVRSECVVPAHDHGIEPNRLGHEHPIEWVAMMRRKPAE
jgi:hypothetical protein